MAAAGTSPYGDAHDIADKQLTEIIQETKTSIQSIVSQLNGLDVSVIEPTVFNELKGKFKGFADGVKDLAKLKFKKGASELGEGTLQAVHLSGQVSKVVGVGEAARKVDQFLTIAEQGVSLSAGLAAHATFGTVAATGKAVQSLFDILQAKDTTRKNDQAVGSFQAVIARDIDHIKVRIQATSSSLQLKQVLLQERQIWLEKFPEKAKKNQELRAQIEACQSLPLADLDWAKRKKAMDILSELTAISLTMVDEEAFLHRCITELNQKIPPLLDVNEKRKVLFRQIPTQLDDIRRTHETLKLLNYETLKIDLKAYKKACETVLETLDAIQKVSADIIIQELPINELDKQIQTLEAQLENHYSKVYALKQELNTILGEGIESLGVAKRELQKTKADLQSNLRSTEERTKEAQAKIAKMEQDLAAQDLEVRRRTVELAAQREDSRTKMAIMNQDTAARLAKMQQELTEETLKLHQADKDIVQQKEDLRIETQRAEQLFQALQEHQTNEAKLEATLSASRARGDELKELLLLLNEYRDARDDRVLALDGDHVKFYFDGQGHGYISRFAWMLGFTRASQRHGNLIIYAIKDELGPLALRADLARPGYFLEQDIQRLGVELKKLHAKDRENCEALITELTTPFGRANTTLFSRAQIDAFLV